MKFQSYEDILRVTMKAGLCPIFGLLIDKFANYAKKFDKLRRDAIQILPLLGFFTIVVLLLTLLIWINVTLTTMWLEL